MLRLAAAAAALTLTLPLISGCGNERAGSAGLFETPSDGGRQALRYPSAGLSVALPEAYAVTRAKRPQLFRASFEDAFVSAFAYRRREQLPRNRDELRAARARLVRAAQKRASSFRLDSNRLLTVARAPAIELLGAQTISRGRLRLRSLHVYKGQAEYVIELGAPTGAFPRLDRATFPQIRRSLKLTGRVKPPARKKGRRR